MSRWRLIWVSARYFLAQHRAVFGATACAAAILTGALAVGDSLREHLRARVDERVGHIDAALPLGSRFVSESLASRLTAKLPGVLVHSLLDLDAVVSVPAGGAAIALGRVRAADDEFFARAGRAPLGVLPKGDGVLIDARLAHHLKVVPGDRLVLRVSKPDPMPRDLVLASVDDQSVAVSVTVRAVIGDETLGGFDLRTDPIPPFNVFVARAWLAERLGCVGRVGTLLFQRADPTADPSDGVKEVQSALADVIELDDLGLVLEQRDGGVVDLMSRRLFLEDAVVEAVASLEIPQLGVLTYFVNGIRSVERVTPYSTVTALGSLSSVPITSEPLQELLSLVNGLGPTQAVVSDWLERDLSIEPGAVVRLEYFVSGADAKLTTVAWDVTVARSAPLRGVLDDPSLMPPFPGLEDAENCRDWDPGIPVDTSKIRDQDEAYWKAHRGAPKLVVGLEVGRRVFGTRFGSLTAIRMDADSAATLRRDLTRRLDPRRVGLVVRDVRTPALASTSAPTDFGGLFLGLSLFLIGSALMLTALPFRLSMEARAREVGTLLALGWRPSQVRWQLLGEGAVIAGLGALAGVPIGLLYGRGLVWGLATLWGGAVGGATLTLQVTLLSIVLAFVGTVVSALLAMFFSLRASLRRPAVALLSGSRWVPSVSNELPRWFDFPSVATFALTVIFFAVSLVFEEPLIGLGAGVASLLLGWIVTRRALQRLAAKSTFPRSLTDLAVRDAGRERARSLTVIALLATAVFLVSSVQVHRQGLVDETAGWEPTGTGGYALFGRTALPIARDPSTAEGRELFALPDDHGHRYELQPLRVRDGDDASCLNLGRASVPEILGIDPWALRDFEFAAVEGLESPRNESEFLLGRILEQPRRDGEIPVVADAATVQWSLHLALGDSLEILDERGHPRKLRIVATLDRSIFQGSLILPTWAFTEVFPSEAGFRRLLVRVRNDDPNGAVRELSRALADVGLELTTTRERLARFDAVQNTYLSIFQVLGGLGVLLGTVGLYFVVTRNIVERRSEFALLLALGFRPKALRQMLGREHRLLVLLGISVGGLSAAIVVFASHGATGHPIPWQVPLLLPLLVGGLGFLVVHLAVGRGVSRATLGSLAD